jgi:hypothetical protein
MTAMGEIEMSATRVFHFHSDQKENDMITITLTHAEARILKNLVRANRICNERIAKTYQCTKSEKKMHHKRATESAAIETKFDSFGI